MIFALMLPHFLGSLVVLSAGSPSAPPPPSTPQWIAPADAAPAGPEPHWIWIAGPDAAPGGAPTTPPTTRNAAEGSVWMTRSFRAPPGARAASIALAADNAATVYLNGSKLLESSDWSTPVFSNATLHDGDNVLSVEARNSPVQGAHTGTSVNPAGVVCRIAMHLSDNSTQHVITDADWRGSAVKWPEFPAAPSTALEPAIDLGPASTAPWAIPTAAFEPAPPCPIFRRTFTLESAPRAASVRLIGLGHYELRCNGRRVGDTLLNQAWSQYDQTIYWQEFDLAPFLHQGENVLGVSLGNSFWRVDPANDAHRYTKTDAMPDFSGGRPYLLWLDATVEMGDSPADTRHIVSDGAWKWTRGPVTFSNVYAGEDFDARLDPPGWDAPAFDEAGWLAAQSVPAPAGAPAALDGPGIREFEAFSTTDIRSVDPANAVFTYVFPQNCSAMLRFTLDGGGPGARVRFRPCEYMEPDGRVKFTYTWGTGKDIWLDYVKRGPGTESHQPLFFYVGAQFVQVEGAVPAGAPNPEGLPVLRSLELVHVRADCPIVGNFDCDRPMHNAAERLIDWSIRSNMSYFPTDCPHREKNSWIEQDWHMARAMSYRYDVHDWLFKTARDIRDAQQPDGHIPTNSPNYLVGVPPHGFWNNAPEWGIAGVLVPWHLYEWYGDRRALDTGYESAKRYVDYLSTTAKDGVITSNLGDWYDFGHGKGNGPSQWTPNEVSATAIWALGADTLARSAEALGKTDDAAQYHGLFAQIRADFQRRFYDPVTHTVRNNGSCQAGTAAALCIGLIPDADRTLALDAIVADLESRAWKQTPGEVLQVFLIRALAESGRSDVLHRVYNRDDVPSYGHMVRSGLTTLPESWDARRGTGDSLNHFMLGHLMEWHFAFVAGIRQQPGSVGWARVLIAPQPPPLSDKSGHAIHHASASFLSPKGVIASSWDLDPSDGAFTLTAEVPPGIEAEAILPDGARHPLQAGRSVLRTSLQK